MVLVLQGGGADAAASGSAGRSGSGSRPRSGRVSRASRASRPRRRKPTLNARERNARRLESNERERMRMHSLNDAFQVRQDSL